MVVCSEEPKCSGSFSNDQSINNFLADCQGAVCPGDTCTIGHPPGFEGGRVECIGGEYNPTPAKRQHYYFSQQN